MYQGSSRGLFDSLKDGSWALGEYSREGGGGGLLGICCCSAGELQREGAGKGADP